jgi:hypothetical protein
MKKGATRSEGLTRYYQPRLISQRKLVAFGERFTSRTRSLDRGFTARLIKEQMKEWVRTISRYDTVSDDY